MRTSNLTPRTRCVRRPSPVRRGVVLAIALVGFACGRPGTQRVKPELSPPAQMLDFGKIPVLNVKQATVPQIGRAHV